MHLKYLPDNLLLKMKYSTATDIITFEIHKSLSFCIANAAETSCGCFHIFRFHILHYALHVKLQWNSFSSMKYNKLATIWKHFHSIYPPPPAMSFHLFLFSFSALTLREGWAVRLLLGKKITVWNDTHSGELAEAVCKVLRRSAGFGTKKIVQALKRMWFNQAFTIICRTQAWPNEMCGKVPMFLCQNRPRFFSVELHSSLFSVYLSPKTHQIIWNFQCSRKPLQSSRNMNQIFSLVIRL